MKKIYAGILVILIAVYCILPKSSEFAFGKISMHRAYDCIWDTPILSPERAEIVDRALSQPYTYFGCGGQCYVFFSADDNYVLKLFKDRYTPPRWLKLLPPYLFDRYKTKKRWKKQDKLRRDLTSYKIAFEELSPHTGLLYVHINPTGYLPTLQITDLDNAVCTLDLNHTDFILQKKAELFYPGLERLMHNQEIQAAKDAITSLVHMMVLRSEKGIRDRDPNILTNCGLLNNAAMKIDVGCFAQADSPLNKQEILATTAAFRQWLLANYPDLCDHLDQTLDQQCQ